MEKAPPQAEETAPACSLQGAAFDERVAAWREVAARALSRTVRPGRISSLYPRDPELVRQLSELVEAEAACCPFLRFTVRDDDDVVRVDLEYPQGFEALLGSVVGST